MTRNATADVNQAEPLDAQAVQVLEEAGLIYVSDTEPGITRQRRGKGFHYRKPDKQPLIDAAQLRRIAQLAIPPAYRDVWICVQARGHLQATGRDARGRKQYRYHARWRELRDCAKFDRMLEFGAALPKLRQRLRRDLALPGLPREKVLAVVVSLLDATRVRIGNQEYAKQNSSFGLSTLRDHHVRFIRAGRALLKFRGKGGAEHEVPIDDKRIARLVRRCQELPGQHLFQYVDDSGARHPIDSGLINDYLRDTMGAEFTAKDFRTWGATLRAIELLAGTPLPRKASERAYQTLTNEVIRAVARELRNTPAVCRKSYINPIVFEAWRSGRLHKAIKPAGAAAPRRLEQAVLRFLRRAGS
jgi:DNA topoisomerase-1